jgi:hypothetical protein
MSTFTSAMLVAGAIVFGLGVRIARSQISDRIVYDVIDAVRESSGNDPSPEAMRAHIRKARQRWGLYVGAAGVLLIAIGLVAA